MPKGFWANLPHPIIGLAPMDGVTDAAFRYIMAKYGKPALMVTEFTSVEGIRAGAERLLEDFLYEPIEHPIVAQLFGADPNAFFGAAVVASALGFDGIDINMGCPAKNVTGHGAGAALILDPERAKEIIRQTKAGAKAWINGIKVDELGLPLPMVEKIELRRKTLGLLEKSRTTEALPVSVKTRLGYNTVIIEEWVQQLLSENPVTITLHGRTLKQLYSGNADWEAIGRAARIIHQTKTLVLGNGDVGSVAMAKTLATTYQTDGALIGRAGFGNPWLFQESEPDFNERLKVALEHARYFNSLLTNSRGFVRIRKHLFDYIKNNEGSREVRTQLIRVENLEEVEKILLPLIIN